MTTQPIQGFDRRQFLGCLAAAPLLPRAGGTKRSLIVVWLDGGASHVDTFDCKPEAPPSVRGDLEITRGNVDGTFVSGHMPRLAKLMDRCTLIRSLSHGEGNHDRGTHLLLTGARPSPVLRYPSIGSIRSVLAGTTSPMPAYVAIPEPPAYGGAGFVGREHAPFAVGGDPGRPDFAVRHLAGGDDIDVRRRLVDRIDELGGGGQGVAERTADRASRQAASLSLQPELRRTFDLKQEQAATRARYGRHRLGQSLLLARRLATAGVGVTVVRDRGWDTHVNIRRALSAGFPPKLTALDQGLSALIDDLERTPAGDHVSVVVMSEFGRTPRLNPDAGRDHWPRAQFALLFGAGVRRGQVIGQTDAYGEEPIEDPVRPSQLFATMCQLTGVDHEHVFTTADGRPIRVTPDGTAPLRAALT